MTGLRWALALTLGAGVTLLLFAAVGSLNQSRIDDAKVADAEAAAQPLIVAPPPEPVVQPAPRSATLQAHRLTLMSATSRLQPSAVRSLGLPSSTMGLDSLLPNLGDVGLGQVSVSEVPAAFDRPARERRTVEPIYPVTAQKRGIEGYVIVRLKIDAQGKVSRVLVVDSEPIGVFERSARDAARRFEFSPAQVGGVAVATTLEKKIVFTLQ